MGQARQDAGSAARLWHELVGTAEGLVLVLHGDLDLGTERELRAALTAALATRDAGVSLIVDVADVGFCAARGLSVLGEVAARCSATGVPFAVRRCPDHVHRLVEVLGLRTLLGLPAAS